MDNRFDIPVLLYSVLKYGVTQEDILCGRMDVHLSFKGGVIGKSVALLN